MYYDYIICWMFWKMSVFSSLDVRWSCTLAHTLQHNNLHWLAYILLIYILKLEQSVATAHAIFTRNRYYFLFFVWLSVRLVNLLMNACAKAKQSKGRMKEKTKEKNSQMNSRAHTQTHAESFAHSFRVSLCLCLYTTLNCALVHSLMTHINIYLSNEIPRKYFAIIYGGAHMNWNSNRFSCNFNCRSSSTEPSSIILMYRHGYILYTV